MANSLARKKKRKKCEKKWTTIADDWIVWNYLLVWKKKIQTLMCHPRKSTPSLFPFTYFLRDFIHLNMASLKLGKDVGRIKFREKKKKRSISILWLRPETRVKFVKERSHKYLFENSVSNNFKLYIHSFISFLFYSIFVRVVKTFGSSFG